MNSDTQADPNLDPKNKKSESWLVGKMDSGRILRSGADNAFFWSVKDPFFLITSEISSFSSVYDAFTSHFVRCMARTGSEWSSLTP